MSGSESRTVKAVQVDSANTGAASTRQAGRAMLVLVLLTTVLALSRWTVLRSPPYVEQAYCLWTESAFLAETDFDYDRLRNQERHADEGGPRAYMYSVLATAIALLLRNLSPPNAFLTYHLFTIACGAFILWNVFRLLRPNTGTTAAVLTCATLATVPLFSTQLEMLGMDLPMVAVASYCAICIRREQYWLVGILSVLAFLFKNSGFLLSAAAVIHLCLLLSFEGGKVRGRRRWLLASLLFNVVICGLEVYVLVAGDNARTRMHVPRSADLYLWRCSAPDVMLTMLIAAVIFGWQLFRTSAAGAKRLGISMPSATHWTARSIAAENGVLIYSWILIAFSTAMILPVFFESRYLTLPVVFLYLSLGLILFDHRDPVLDMSKATNDRLPWAPGVPRRFALVGMGLLLVLNLVNRNGLLYEQLSEQSARGWGVLERSHEYWADHRSNVAAASVLESECRGRPLLVSDQFVHLLTVSQLGYVKQSLLDPPPTWKFDAGDENIRQLFEARPDDLVVTYTIPQRQLSFPAYVLAPPTALDEILFNDGLRPSNVIYIRRCNPADSISEKIEHYLNLLFWDSQRLDPVTRLTILGWIDLAREYLESQTGRQLDDRELRSLLWQRLDATQTSLAAQWSHGPGDPAYERLLRAISDRQAYLAALDKPLEAMPPLSLESRGLTIELPQRLLFFPAASRSRSCTSDRKPEIVLSKA